MGLISLVSEKPSDKAIRKLQLISIVLYAIVYPIMVYMFFISGFKTSNTITSQLCFSGVQLKIFYLDITNLTAYRIAQIMDYGYMIAYGLLVYTCLIRVMRHFVKNQKLEKIAPILVLLAILTPIFDMVENAFILLTLTDIIGFPNWYAVAHSVFALPKWIFLITLISIVLCGYIYRKVKKIE